MSDKLRIIQITHRKLTSVFVEQNGCFADFNTSDSWVILSSIEQSIKKKINYYGKPLKEWEIEIYRGILTGCNDAFIISGQKRDELIAADPKSAEIIRPVLRGRDIGRYKATYADLWLIATFPSKQYDIENYPAVKDYLLSFGIERLEQSGKIHIIGDKTIESRKKTNNKWFETQDSISYWDDFSKRKIVWARLSRISTKDFNDFPKFCIVDEGYVTLDSLCFFTGPNLDSLVKVLNSKYAAYYFFKNVAILDNGGMQMRQQYVENICIPFNALKALELCHDETQYDKIILEAFCLTEEEQNYIEDYLNKKKEEIEDTQR